MKKASLVVLIMAFLAFIARGIPDSILGSAWPVMRDDLQLEDTKLGILMFIIAVFIILTSLFNARLLNRFSTEKSVVFGILLTVVSFFGFSYAKNFVIMCLWAVPIGVATGIIEAQLNTYISLRYDSKYINYLHCFYGVGVICSPYFMSVTLKNGNWRGGFLIVAIIEAVIAVIIAFSFGCWKKVEKTQTEEASGKKAVSVIELLKKKSIRVMIVVLFLTNVVEYTCSTWGCTYLVEEKSFSPDKAAGYIILFFAGMAIGRFTSGAISRLIHTWTRVFICLIITLFGVLFIVCPLPAVFSVIGLFIIGLGNGPIYPNLISLTPFNFDKEISESVMGLQIASAFAGVLITPLAYGVVKQYAENTAFSLFLISAYIIMAVLLFAFVNIIKKNGHYNKTA